MSASCARRSPELSRRDAALGAAAMLGGTLLFSLLGIVLKRSGLEATGESLLSVAFPGALLFSLPFTYSKGKPWHVQMLLVVIPVLLLIAIAALAQLI
jgi:hypothetical protein